MTQANEPIISFKNVTKTFGAKSQSSEVLHNVNFTIPRGSFTILFGPSGSGKTTILNTLIGLEAPTSGTVTVDGQDLYKLSNDQRANFRSLKVGMVHQDNYWVNSLPTLENVALPLYLAGWERSKARDTASRSIERIGLSEYKHYPPTILSGGQQQRMSFARATVTDPLILVADEPTGNLDSKSGDLIIKLLCDFNQNSHSTIVLVTHNQEFLPYANNIIMVHDGTITEQTHGQEQKVAS